MIRTIQRMAAAAAAVVALAGCEGSTEPVPADVVGTYQLVSWDGKPLPAVIGTRDGEPVTALRGDLVLREDGEYVQLIESRFISGEAGAQTGVNAARGQYSVRGERIQLRETLGPTHTGSVRDQRITYSIPVGGEQVTLEWRAGVPR